jgi:hypothetical protein
VACRMELHNRNSHYRAARYLRSAAEAGHSGAAFQLSLILTGRGREQQRLDWLRRAAEFARNEGQPASTIARYLGDAALRAGRDGEAERYLRAAAEGGSSKDQIALADFLVGKSRIGEALPLLHKLGEHAAPGNLLPTCW